MSKVKAKTKNWVQRQKKDVNVRKAAKDGYRSRAAYKLIELDDKYKFIKPANYILELGCAPGSWSQVIIERKKKDAKLLGIDLLDVKPLNELVFTKGDFTDNLLQAELSRAFPKIDLILSDAAPDISGIKDRDNESFIELHQAMLRLVTNFGANVVLLKTFNGEAEIFIKKKLKEQFSSVATINVKATRSYSKECYILAKSK